MAELREMKVFLGTRYIGTLFSVHWHGGDTPWGIEVVDDDGQLLKIDAKKFKIDPGQVLMVEEGTCCQVLSRPGRDSG